MKKKERLMLVALGDLAIACSCLVVPVLVAKHPIKTDIALLRDATRVAAAFLALYSPILFWRYFVAMKDLWQELQTNKQ